MAVSKYEIKAKKELEAQGYQVDDKRGMSRWSKNRDFWNLFDLVAIPADRSYILWLSIKGHQGIPGWHLKEIKEFKMPAGNRKEIWNYRNLKRKKKTTRKVITEPWHKIVVD